MRAQRHFCRKTEPLDLAREVHVAARTARHYMRRWTDAKLLREAQVFPVIAIGGRVTKLRTSASWQQRPMSKMQDQIAGHRKLILPSAVVVGLLIPGALETQFRTQLDGGADPMTPHDRVL